ncbi:MAG: L,D-transpeptidase family protein [Akkermansia sp.]|nr:L,D-transpeptidase family protein [Akkermansia sp.]
MRALLKIILLAATIVWICSCQQSAVIHGDSQYKNAPIVTNGCYVRSMNGGIHTGYKLLSEPGELPLSHDEFIRSSTYPITYSVWLNPALMQERGNRHVRIMLGKQRGIYFVQGLPAMDFPVCTGSGRKSTPTGRYHILEKHIKHRSNLYDCPMSYFMRLTWGGIGMHVGDIYRTPASHGCIRLPQVACKPLYQALSCGSVVYIDE